MIPTGAVLFDLPSFDTWMINERPRLSLYRHDQERLHSNGHNGHIATLPEPWGDHDQARRLARDAVSLALPAHDPVVALQARSTLSVVHMHEGRFNQAAREAAMARRYSGTDALIVLAIQGVAVRRANGPSAAQSVFADLVDQANLRTGLNDRDFAAWTLTGIARCAQALDTPTGSTKPALDDFTRARHPYREPAPALTRMMTFLLETIAADDEERARLKPAVDDLRSSLSHSAQGQGER
ncbi:hypothetical protein [Micromonospora sp. NPDC005161]